MPHRLVWRARCGSWAVAAWQVNSAIRQHHMPERDELIFAKVNKLLTASTVISVDDTFRISAAISKRSWQRYCDNNNTFNTNWVVQTKVTFPRRRDVGVAYCTVECFFMIPRWMWTVPVIELVGLLQLHLCATVISNKTTEHFLLHCSNYSQWLNYFSRGARSLIC